MICVCETWLSSPFVGKLHEYDFYCCRGKSKSDVFSTIKKIKYEHNCFTLASSVNSHNKSFQLSFITERPRIRLNCFKYLGPKLLSVSQKLLKT